MIQEFCKADESLEDEEHTGQPSEVDNDQLRAIIKADPVKTTWEVAEELNIGHSVVVWHWKQIKRVHHELTANKKNCFEVLSSYSMQQEWTISQQDYDMWRKVDFIWQPAMTSSVVGLRRNPKALPKVKLAPK